MIVQCEKCRTKFNVNETSIKDEGSKVKCSRCKHVFVVFPVEQPEQIEAKEQLMVIAGGEGLEALEETTGEGPNKGIDHIEIFEERSIKEVDILEAEYQEDRGGIAKSADMKEASSGDIEKKGEDGHKDVIETIRTVSEEKQSHKSNRLLILIVSILILLGIYYAVTKWPLVITDFLKTPSKELSEEQKSSDSGASRLEILTVNGAFVNSETSGRFFVIRGKVRNGYPKNRSFILLKGSVLDDRGQVVKEKTAYAGNALEEKDLLKLPLEEIDRAMENRPGLDNKNINVIPGTTVDFMIVFENLPENLSEYTVGPVSSSPGSPEP